MPRVPDWESGACSILRVKSNIQDCAAEFDEAELDLQREILRPINERIVEAGGTVADFSSRWCSEGRCSTVNGESIEFRDQEHITVGASEALVGEFAELIAGRTPSQALPFVADD